jgi:hypothetical protein
MRKLIVLPLAALAVMLLCHAAPSAQPAGGKPDEDGFWKSYDIEDLYVGSGSTDEDDLVPRVTPVLAAGPLYPEGRSRYDDPYQWTIQTGQQRDDFASKDAQLEITFENAINHLSDTDSKLQTTPTHVLELWANKQGHELTAKIIENLRQWCRLKSYATLYRLTQPRDGCVLGAAEVKSALDGATLLGRQTGEPGETLVWHNLDFQTCLNDYETYSTAEDPTPQMIYTRYPRGWEVAAGVLPGGDGRMLVHAYAGTAAVVSTRKLNAAGREVEVPRITSRFHPATATLTPGEGLLLDGRYLLVPGLAETIKPIRYKSTLVTLPTAVLRVGGMTHGAWPGDIKAGCGFPETHEYDGLEQLHAGGADCLRDAADEFRSTEKLHGSYVECVGPLVVIQGEELIEPKDRKTDKEFENVVHRLTQGPGWTGYSVTLYSVDAKDLKQAEPPGDWLAKHGTALASYTGAALSGQVADWHDLMAETYYACGDSVWSTLPVVDPVMRTAVAGTRVRLRATAGETSRLNLTAAYAPRLEIKQSAAPDPTGGKAESADLSAAQLRLQADLKVGGSASSVVPYPGDEGKRLVLFVKRLK